MFSIILDGNLLVLLIAGTASRDYIGKHRRLRDYNETDFDLLLQLIKNASRIIVTPNTLTETSNLVQLISEPARAHIAETFRALIGKFEERYVTSIRAAEQPEFARLWLTDCALLDELANSHMLLTADLDLYLTAANRGYNAVNFNHLR
jgi:hypothetical protein